MSRNTCRFWQQGNCRYGDNCKFDHPGARTQQSSNRYSALSGGSQNQMSSQRAPELPYSLNKEILRRDLAEERPPWPLSCYGPGRDAPEQLFGGYPREQSYEEIRLHYLQGAMSGNPQGAINEIEALHQSAQQQIQSALGNLDGAIQYITDAANKHPNRIDICKQNTTAGATPGGFAAGQQQQPGAFGGTSSSSSIPFGAPQSTSAFGAPSSQTPGAFGQPSAIGQRPGGAFGAPAFGQPAQPAGAASTGAFGAPSQPATGFGQPSALGAKPSAFGAPAFGQPAQPAAGSAFGQPSQPAAGSAFGQPSQPAAGSAFGQPSQPAAGSAFGQPSQPGGAPAFGQPTQPGSTSAFGQPSQPASTSALGQPSQPASTSAFGQPSQPGTIPAFGQPSQPTSAFGQTSGLGQKPTPFSNAGAGAGAGPSANPFGQPPQSQQQQNANPFGGQPSQAGSSAFGQPSASNPFAKPSPAAANPFGQPQQPTPNPFGAGGSAGGAAANAMDTATNGTGATTSPFGGPSPAAGGAALNPFQPAAQGAPAGFAAPAAAAAATAPGQPQGPYGPNASRQHPPIESYSAKEPDGRLRMFKGKAVEYEPSKSGGDKEDPFIRNFDGSLTRVWFPNGPTPYTRDTEGEDDRYDEATTARWKAFVQTGRFDDGVMPEVPPKREFCTWDF